MHKFFNIAATCELQDDAEWNSIENGGGGLGYCRIFSEIISILKDD